VITSYRLADVWDKFNAEQKQRVTEQLHDFLSQLRHIKESFIGYVDGTACADPLFDENLGAYGPYQDAASFNEAMITALKDTTTGGWVDTVCDMVAVLKDHEIVLTRGDISPRNIIVQGSKVVAILDWEMAGFYPEYWGYAKALYRPAWESDWIKDKAANKILQPYLTELAVSLHSNSVGVW
jgi:aminoglycoside phosphotransferase (APT) family kinase protein